MAAPVIPGQRTLERTAAKDGLTKDARTSPSKLWVPPQTRQTNMVKALRNRQ